MHRLPFLDRRDAGKKLAAELSCYANQPNVVVLGLPRGGIPVAFEVAIALKAPLDVFVVRKLGVPGHRELAMGAIASGGVRVLNSEVVEALGIAPMVIDAVAQQEIRETYCEAVLCAPDCGDQRWRKRYRLVDRNRRAVWPD